jgi:hypothetical protein
MPLGIFNIATSGRKKDRLIVSLAGTTGANGFYKITGESSGKDFFTKEDDANFTINYDGTSKWILTGAALSAVYSAYSCESPDVNSLRWKIGGGDLGAAPAPRVEFW